MARMLSYFARERQQGEVSVLVATSGDTGSAVANGFLGVKGIKVFVLYPSGKVSAMQEAQFTTLGQNITALEVDGTFDDCQALVKAAFMDSELNDRLHLTSANSINVARFLPQSFYYYWYTPNCRTDPRLTRLSSPCQAVTWVISPLGSSRSKQACQLSDSSPPTIATTSFSSTSKRENTTLPHQYRQ